MEAILETKAEIILQFMRGLRGSLQATFEEGTCAARLHDLLKPHVTHLVVCDPRKNNLGKGLWPRPQRQGDCARRQGRL